MKTKPLNANRLRVGLISLGCAKNLVDSEIMLGALLRDGLEITNDPRQADAVIINTCSFIASAQQESVDAILESAAERDARNPAQAVIVSGCMPQRFREELPKLLPEVDAFMGIDQVAQVGDIVLRMLTGVIKGSVSVKGSGGAEEGDQQTAMESRAHALCAPEAGEGTTTPSGSSWSGRCRPPWPRRRPRCCRSATGWQSSIPSTPSMPCRR